MENKNIKKSLVCFALVFTLMFFIPLVSATNPTVSILDVVDITHESAELRGEVSDMGDFDSVKTRFGTAIGETSDPGDFGLKYASETTFYDTGSTWWDYTDLEPDTDYSVIFAYYHPEDNVWYYDGTTLSFTTESDPEPDPDPPVVLTYDATEVEETSAKLRGCLTSMGDYDEVQVSFAFREGLTGDWSSITGSMEDLTSTGNFDYVLTGLDESQYYQFRAQGYYDGEFIEGFTKSFITGETILDDPVIATNDASDITQDSAKLHGELTDLGDYDEVTISFGFREEGEEWQSISGSLQDLTATGSFFYDVSDLDLGTTYEFKAQGSYDGEFVYGDTKEFTTDDADAPVVATNDADNIDSISAKLHGELTDLGDYDEVAISFGFREEGEEWQSIFGSFQDLTATGSFNYDVDNLNSGTTYEFKAQGYYDGKYINGDTKEFTTDDAGWTNTTKENVINIGVFDETASDLSSGTNYTFRAVVEDNEGNLYYGDYLTFETTSLDEPSILTHSATGVGKYNAEIRGELTSLGDYDFVDVSFGFREQGEEWQSIFGSFQNLTETGTFSYNVTDLSSATTYEFRAQGYYDGEYINGDTLNFTTLESVVVPPSISEEIPDINLGFNEQYELNISEYFDDWQSILFKVDGITIPLPSSLIDDELDPVVSVEQVGNDLVFDTYENEYSYNIELEATNSEGEVSQEFELNVMEDPPEPPEPDEPITTSLVDSFLGLFPDSEDLTARQRWAFVFIVMFIVTAILLAITHSSTGGIPPTIIYLSLFFNFIIFLFFVSVGYIGWGTLAIIGLIGIGIGAIKIFQGRGLSSGGD